MVRSHSTKYMEKKNSHKPILSFMEKNNDTINQNSYIIKKKNLKNTSIHKQKNPENNQIK
ncbi:hypothetical protein ES708_15158 [subsurface metagenome]